MCFMLARVRTPYSPVRVKEKERVRACFMLANVRTPSSHWSERERERERDKEREGKRKRGGER